MTLKEYMATKVVATAAGTHMCTLCGNIQAYRRNVPPHFRKKHMELCLVYNCPTCGLGFQTRNDFLAHVASVHPEWQGVRAEDFAVSHEK